jgi:tetratricopeptide (TPR) repeat protein
MFGCKVSRIRSMNELLVQPVSRRRGYRWLLMPGVVLLAALLGLGSYGYALRTAPRRHFQAALTAFARNDLDRVLTAHEALQGVDGYEPHRRLLAGMILLRSQRLLEAIVEFGFAREHSDTRALAYTLSGEALYKSKQFRDAQRILAAALQWDPQQTDAHRWLAALYYDVGAMNQALSHLAFVAQQAPGDPRPHRLTGLIHKDFEEYTKAINAYRESLKRGPSQPDKEAVLLELAECQSKLQQHKEALETLRTCPSSAQCLWLQAECRRALGDQAVAGRLVDEAIAREPSHLPALQLKGTLDLEAGNAAAAVDVLSKAVKAYPKEWRPRYTLAMAYKRLGDAKQAAEQLKTYEELRALRDRFTKLHTQAIQEPDNAERRYELGVVARQLDKPLLAISWFEAALALQPAHEKARASLQELTRGSRNLPDQQGASTNPNPSP